MSREDKRPEARRQGEAQNVQSASFRLSGLSAGFSALASANLNGFVREDKGSVISLPEGPLASGE